MNIKLFSAALLLAAAPAFAEEPAIHQRNTANQQGVTATNPAGSDMIKPDQMRASKLMSEKVYDVNNAKLGDVQDIVLDKDGKVANVVIEVGGFLGLGSKFVAVPFSDIKFDHNRLTLNRTEQQLKDAAPYVLNDKWTGAGEESVPVHGGHGGNPLPGK